MISDINRCYKPSTEETIEYYYGIAGKPKLVARTSSDLWVKPECKVSAWGRTTEQAKKRFWPIQDDDDIVQHWTEELCITLAEILSPYPWTYFFPVKMPLGRGNHYSRSQEERFYKTAPVLLLIAVNENSIQWEEGIEMALKCQRCLHDHNIGIEVEVREGRRHHHGVTAEFENLIDETLLQQPREATNPMEFIDLMSSKPGYGITYLKDHNSSGTMGLHITLGDDKKIYGLTCRHVVDKGQPLERAYKITAQDQRQYHVHSHEDTIAKVLTKLTDQQDTIEKSIQIFKRKKDKWDLFGESDPYIKAPTSIELDALARWPIQLDYNKKLAESLRKAEASKKERLLGHVAFYPPFEISTKTPGYLRDWALLELDKANCPKGIDNQVSTRNMRLELGMPMLPNPVSQSIQLEYGSRYPFELPDEVAKKSFKVGKVGATSGYTLGMTSAIQAVVRAPKRDNRTYFSWELLIVPIGDDLHFSEPGDSGASIFDGFGWVVGMVVGSSHVDQASSRPESSKDAMKERDRGIDITFASSIDWVLDDIQALTGFEPRLV
ncbi:hypothetical protein F4777DRAFT_596381 [Nemania sp. FL0916]|nr:hypothetical protein F4777DRAFT_596381 [Nemania sp. FL0916]